MHCVLRAFDASALCHHVMPPRPSEVPEILFVGDSYTGQLFISFVSMMRGSIHRNEGDVPRTLNTGAWASTGFDATGSRTYIPITELRADALACIDESSHYAREQRPPLRIAFVRNELLSIDAVAPQSHHRHGYPWLDKIGKNTLLVLQVTAWLGSDTRSLESRLSQIRAQARRRMGGQIWRQQVLLVSPSMGHRHCRVVTAVGVVEPPKAPNASHLARAELMHRKGKELARRMGFTYLDITTPLQNRSDGHMPSDCGHWCLPGPYDVAAEILFNALLAGTPKRNIGPRPWPRTRTLSGASALRDLRRDNGAIIVEPLRQSLAASSRYGTLHGDGAMP